MFKRMFVKEWKEKSGLFVFALAALAVFAVALFAYAKDKEALDILSSTAILVFLPVFSVLLGSSGFFSEFPDGAWAYLFSRPVKKSRVWLAKYLSLLTILVVVIFLFFLLTQLHPALKPAPDTFNFPLVDENMSFGILACVLPLLLFTTAFSFSILSEKVYIVAFLAAVVWIVLQLVITRAGFPLLERGMYSSAFSLISILSILVPLSLVAASLITLNTADFSQPRRRALTFTRSAAIFILASIGLVILLAVGTKIFQGEHYIYGLKLRNEGLYFATEKGFFRYDPARGKTDRLARQRSMWGHMSVGGDKLAIVTYHLGGRGREYTELRIMSLNGGAARPLLGTGDQGSPLYGGIIYPVCVSPAGDKVAFIARYVPKTTRQDLWMINSDGSGLKGYDVRTPEAGLQIRAPKTLAENYQLVGFANSGRAFYLLYTARVSPGGSDQGAGAKLLSVDLDSGRVAAQADGIRKPYVVSMAPASGPSGSGPIAYIRYHETMAREVLTLLDPESMERREVDTEGSVTAFRWDSAGDKLAFLTADSKLGVYSMSERRVIQIRELAGYDLRWPTQALEWTLDGRIVLRKLKGEGSSLCLLGADLVEQKSIPLPFDTYYASRFWSVGSTVVVEDTDRSHLWALDLTTEKWLRVY